MFDFVRKNRHRLDMGVDSAYTTEFLDGPEKYVEGDHCGIERGQAGGHEQGHGQGQDRHGQEKAGVLQEEIANTAARTIARTQEEGRMADEDPTVDLADKAANSYTKEFLFGMTNTDRTILNMIDAALKRIQSDEYGVCANCQEELQQKRLEAVPWAKHCLACQEKMEQGLLQ